MRRKRVPKSRDVFDRSHNDDLDLATAPDSDLADFGETATRGFSDAWDDSGESAGDLEAAYGFSSDPDDTKGRNLDKKSKVGVVLLGVIVVIGGGLGYAVQSGLFERGDSGAGADDPAASLVLAPGAVRAYKAEPKNIELSTSGASVDLFRAAAGEVPVPDNGSATGLPSLVGAGPVLWAGRMHIAVFGDGLGAGAVAGELCAVATLVTGQLAAIDVAGHGACDPALSATGDRLACSGDDLLLLEVWSDDPGIPGEPPPIAGVRYRVVEAFDPASEMFSRRGSLLLPSDPTVTSGSERLIEVAAELGGAPDDVVTIASADGAFESTCTLIDRSAIEVRLLPS